MFIFESIISITFLKIFYYITCNNINIYLKNTAFSNFSNSNYFKLVGFYRVNYDDDNWNALVDQLHNNYTEIHVLNRAQIIDDLFNLAKINYVDYNLVMNAIRYLKNEIDVVPWYSVKKGFEYLLDRMWRHPEGFKYLKVIKGK